MSAITTRDYDHVVIIGCGFGGLFARSRPRQLALTAFDRKRLTSPGYSAVPRSTVKVKC
jgi:hypothetical protein